MDQKLLVNLSAALVPVIIGAVWYNPYLLGRIWPQGVGLPEEKMTAGKLALSIIFTYVAGFYIARSLCSVVIHQHGVYAMLANEPDVHVKGTELYNTVQGLMDKYGNNFRTFKHGALHGSLTGVYLVLPILLVVGFWDCKKPVWLFMHAAYWIMCLAVMGGIVCAYMP